MAELVLNPGLRAWTFDSSADDASEAVSRWATFHQNPTTAAGVYPRAADIDPRQRTVELGRRHLASRVTLRPARA